jgi:hypothetical protein
VFDVRNSLVVEVHTVEDEDQAKQFGVEAGTALIKYDFVLVTKKSVADLRQTESEKALAAQGHSFRFVDGSQVPNVD